MSSSLLITGLGAISSAGPRTADLATTLSSGRAPTSEIDRSDGYHRRGGARLAALVDRAGIAEWLSPMAARRMSPPSRFAVASALQALAEAEVDAASDRFAGRRCAVVLGTSYGPSSYTEGILRQVFLESPSSVSPMLFTESVANAPTAQVALNVGAHGPNITVTQREISTLIAVARAAREVEAGRADWALAGGVEEMNPLLHAVLDRHRALASARGGREEVALPFALHRHGFLAGEGAAVVVIEREEDARSRDASGICRLAGWGAAFDPEAPVGNWSRQAGRLGDQLARGIDGDDGRPVDLVVSGASGSVTGDRAEADWLRAAIGAPSPPVIAPKAVLGEWGGGQLAAGVLAFSGTEFGPTPGHDDPDPELGITPHRGGALDPPSKVAVTSLAAGGGAAWLVLERAE